MQSSNPLRQFAEPLVWAKRRCNNYLFGTYLYIFYTRIVYVSVRKYAVVLFTWYDFKDTYILKFSRPKGQGENEGLHTVSQNI